MSLSVLIGYCRTVIPYDLKKFLILFRSINVSRSIFLITAGIFLLSNVSSWSGVGTLPNSIFLCPDGHEQSLINPNGFQWFDLEKDDSQYILEQSIKIEQKL